MNNSKANKTSKDTLFKSDNNKTREAKQKTNRVQKTVSNKQEYSEFKGQEKVTGWAISRRTPSCEESQARQEKKK